MKNFQQNLLIVLALGLCVLCVFQWRGQTNQRAQIQTLNQLVYEKAAAIEGYTNSISAMDHQIASLSTQIAQLTGAARTNEQLLAAQKREITRLEDASESLTNEIVQYKQAVETLQSKLKEAFDGVQKQNDAIKELVTQRDEFVKKYNDSVKDRNDVVTKYNDLVRQVEKANSK
jgi:chromosome segregation ATPase